MSFIKELKRRNVIRVAIAYVIVAWLIAQVTELALDSFAAPDWVVKTVLFLLIVGFPLALIFAWAFEVTPEGIKLEKHITPSAASDVPSTQRLATRQKIVWAIGVAVVGLLAVLAGLNLGGLLGGAAPGPITSIAVLPLKNLSGDPEQAYFTDGMTEALTAELGQIEALKVISRTSAMHYKATDKLLPEIARELNVEALLEGSVLQAGDEVRITLQLVHGHTDRQLWSRNFERELRDILALQGDVARAIAEEIQIALTPEAETRFTRARTVDPEVYRLWLKGNFHLSRMNYESFRRGLASYQEAIGRNPDYAPAYAGLAWAYIHLGGVHGSVKPNDVFPLAKEAAERALALDHTVAEAHLALARIRAMYDWDWAGAERAFKEGIALDPSATFGRLSYANFLTALGRSQESIEIGRQTLDLDPVSPNAYSELAFSHMNAGRHDEALELWREALEINPDYAPPRYGIGKIYAKRGDFDKALEQVAELERRQPESPTVMGFAGRMYGFAGRQTEARALLSRLLQRRGQEYLPASRPADIYIGLGEHEEALRWLELAYEERDVAMVWLKESMVYESLRHHPRFQALLDRMDFPEL